MYKINLFVTVGIIVATATLVGGTMIAPVFAMFHEKMSEGLSNMTGGMGSDNTTMGSDNTTMGMDNSTGMSMADNTTMQ